MLKNIVGGGVSGEGVSLDVQRELKQLIN